VQRLDEQLEKGSGALHTQMKKQQTLCDAKKKQKQKQKNKSLHAQLFKAASISFSLRS
jgi:hypothetical protein